MHIERINSAFRLALFITVAFATWRYLPALRTFANLVGAAHQSQPVNAGQSQLPAANLTQPQLPPVNVRQQLATALNVPPRQSQAANTAQRTKLSATALELALQREPQFRPESQLHCRAATRGWDYTCSYKPTPLLSSTRLEFGARVDATRWIELSRVVPAGTTVPRPQKRAPGATRP